MTVLEFIEPEPSTDSPRQTGTLFSILSISSFIFLITFWIAISGATPTRTLCLVVAGASILALLIGAIFGIVGTVYGKKKKQGSTLVMGIVGLCLNGLFLIGMLLVTLIATVATVVRLHQPKNPVPASTVALPQQYYSESNVNLTQNNMRIAVNPVGSSTASHVYYRPSIQPTYPQSMQVPLAPLQPLQPLRPLGFPQPIRPIYVPRPSMIITPMGIRRY